MPAAIENPRKSICLRADRSPLLVFQINIGGQFHGRLGKTVAFIDRIAEEFELLNRTDLVSAVLQLKRSDAVGVRLGSFVECYSHVPVLPFVSKVEIIFYV